MFSSSQKVGSNGSHKVSTASPLLDLAPEAARDPTLLVWAELYLRKKVLGIQSPNTEQAKRRDLKAFLDFFVHVNGHLRIDQWFARDTRAFLKQLEKMGRAPATINRVFRTLRHFEQRQEDGGTSPRS
jgi:hypothetical protein